MNTVTLEEIKRAQTDLSNLIAALTKQPPTIFTVDTTLPAMNSGERYVGAIISADGTKREHIILLPGDNDVAGWGKQMEWAASIGGELPDRVESALLFATMKDEFKPEWYWLREQHAAYSSYAWMQYFDYGNQDDVHKGYQYRARAVRRVAI